MSSRLAQRTVGGLGWMALGAGGQVVAQVVVLAVLARLIPPRDHGLVAAALIVVNLSTVLAESGIGTAIVQRRELHDDDLRVGLTLTVGFALAAWAALAAGARALGAFFDIDTLPPVLVAVSAVFVIRSLSLGEYLLARRLAFQRLALVELAGYVVGYGGIAVVLALRGAGVWAIVGGQIGQAVVRTVLLSIVAPHPLRPLLSRSTARDLLAYGGGHTLARLANWAAVQGDNLVVGRWMGPTALGLYGRAYQLMSMPATLFGQVANEVLFPAMAEVQADRRALAMAYEQAVAAVALLALPLSAVAALVSGELVQVLLGPRFAGVGDAFEVMVFGILFRTSYKISDCLARATGAVYRRAWRQACYAAAVVGGAIVGQLWGLRGVAVAVLLALAANFGLMAHLSLGLVGMSWSRFARAHLPAVIASAAVLAVAAPAVLALRAAGASPLVVLAGASAAGLAGGLALVRATPRLAAARPLRELLAALAAMLPASLAVPARRLLGPGYAPVLEGAAR